MPLYIEFSEKSGYFAQEDLDIYIRAHGFEATEQLTALIKEIGPSETLGYMKAIVDSFEGYLRENDIPVFTIAKETRAIDFAATIREKIRDKENQFYKPE